MLTCKSQTLCSERIPKEVLANLVTLLPHLDGPSYPMRSAIVTALGNIVAAVFAANQVRGWMPTKALAAPPLSPTKQT